MLGGDLVPREALLLAFDTEFDEGIELALESGCVKRLGVGAYCHRIKGGLHALELENRLDERLGGLLYKMQSGRCVDDGLKTASPAIRNHRPSIRLALHGHHSKVFAGGEQQRSASRVQAR